MVHLSKHKQYVSLQLLNEHCRSLKVVANEDTDNVADTIAPLFARARNICRGQKICVRDTKMFLKNFLSVTNVSRFGQHENNHDQQCVRNKVFSFATALSILQRRKSISMRGL